MNYRDTVQWKMVDALRESLRSIGSGTARATTGFGKTQAVVKILEKSGKDTKILFIAPRINNVTDAASRFNGAMNIGSLGLEEDGNIVCTTKQSIHKIDTSKFDLCIFDEFHQYKEEFIESVDIKYKIFLSATPWNNSGYLWDQFDCVPEPCFEFNIRDAIKHKILCPYEVFGTKNSYNVDKFVKRKGDYTKSQLSEIIKTAKIENQIREMIDLSNIYKLKKVVILFSNIEHAEKGKAEIDKYEESMIIHSKIKKSHDLIDVYKNNSIRFCASVLVLSEGTDIPQIDGIVILRSTKSSRLLTQAIGRGLRLYEGKEKCMVFDFSSSIVQCGTPHNPIIPCETKSDSTDDGPVIKQCEECYFIWEKENDNTCPNCGHINTVKRDVEKNLKESLLEEKETFCFIYSRNSQSKMGKTRNGSTYMSVKNGDAWHTLFGYQYKAVLSTAKHTGMCKVFYTKSGKYRFKYLKCESYLPVL